MVKQFYIRIKPQLIFFVIYTVAFVLFAMTLSITLPFIIGLLTALLLQPIFIYMRGKLKFKSAFAAVIATGIVFALIFGLIAWLVFTVINETVDLVVSLSKTDTGVVLQPIINAVEGFLSEINAVDADFIASHQEEIMNFAGGGLKIISNVFGMAVVFFKSVPRIFTMIIVTIFSTYYLTKDIKKIKSAFRNIVSDNEASNINRIYNQGTRLIGKFVKSYMLIYLATFVESVIVFWALGIKYPLLIGLITGIADIVPILGPGTVYIPLAVIELLTGNTFTGIWLLIAWVAVTVIRQIIEPRIISHSIQIHPLVILAALYASLVLHSISVLLYIISICILYNIFIETGLFQPIFNHSEESAEGGEDLKAKLNC